MQVKRRPTYPIFHYKHEYTFKSNLKNRNYEKKNYGCTISIHVRISEIKKKLLK